jgi:two-component system heavy metal sensor histidine kinase CusS
MANRLTIALCVLAILVFTTVALLLYRALETELTRVRQRDLAGKVDVVRHFLEEVHSQKDLQDLRHHLDDVLIGDGHMRIWLVGKDGAVLYGGQRRPELHTSRPGELHVRREDGLLMPGQQISLPDHPVLPASELIVAVDTREQQALLRRYRTTIATVCGLGVALTVLIAAWVARQSLRPVKQLSKEAAALSPLALSARLSPVHTSELQLLVESFNRALDRVEAAYGQLEAFSADVAHELRTPLATMISATEVALRRPRTTEELRETLQLNLEVLREQSGLVNDMLFLAQADRGQLADSLQETDLAREAERVAEYFEAMLDESKQRLVIEGQVTTSCNPSLLRRALVNLVGNAIRYTEAGGTITISLSDRDGWIDAAVRNPGPSIPPELLPRLFERFFRADAARERGTGHHGLGLAIVRAVAIMHGGQAFARSADGLTEIGMRLPGTLHPNRKTCDQKETVA